MNNMDEVSMTYNSQKEKLIISEYGRNVQDLINHVKTVEDKEKRQRMIESIIQLMYQMSDSSKHISEYQHRLWNHVFKIADGELDVDLPEGVEIVDENVTAEELLMDYPDKHIRFKHYGKNIYNLVQKAVEMEEGEIRMAFIQLIGSYMKLSAQTWNRVLYVSDQIIKADFAKMSDGKLEIPEELQLNVLKATSKAAQDKFKKSQAVKGQNKSRNYKGKGKSKHSSNKRHKMSRR